MQPETRPRRTTLAKLLSILLVCALLLLAGYLAWPGGLQSSLEEGTQAQGHDQAEGEGLKEDGLGSQSPSDLDQGRRKFSPEESEQDGILLQVTQHKTGEPALGVRVYLIDKESEHWQFRQDQINALPKWRQQDHLLAPNFGQAFTTDASGNLGLPPTSPEAKVFAFAEPGLQGDSRLALAVAGKLHLTLEPVIEIPIRVVVNNHGPVARQRIYLAVSRLGASTSARGVTDEDGLARIRLPSEAVRDGLADWEQFNAVLLSPFSRVPRQAFQRRSGDPEPYLFQFDAGSLQVLLPEGVSAGDEQVQVELHVKNQGVKQRKTLEGDQVTFDVLPLKSRYYAILKLPEQDLQFRTEMIGMGRSGETVIAVLQPWAGNPVLSFRLVDEQGKPFLGGEPLRVRHSGENWSTSGGAHGIDAEGRLRLELRGGAFLSAHKMDLRTRHEGRGYWTVLHAAGNYPGGVTDLGDLVMLPEPLVVRGRVVTAAGEPLVGVRIRTGDHKDARGQDSKSVLPSVETDESGSFAIYSFESIYEFRLYGFLEGWHLDESLQLRRGARDVLLSMDRSGSIKSSLMLDMDPRNLLSLELRSQSPNHWVSSNKARLVRSTDSVWQVVFSDVPAGSYEIRALAMQRVPLSIRGDVLVQPGEPTKVDPFDLRGKLRFLELTIKDESGKPVDGAELSLSTASGSHHIRSKSDAMGRAGILHWGERLDLGVRSEAAGFARLQNLQASQEIVLRRLMLRLHFDPELPFMSPDDRVAVQLVGSSGGFHASRKGVSLSFDAKTKSHEIFVPAAAEMDLHWQVTWRQSLAKLKVRRLHRGRVVLERETWKSTLRLRGTEVQEVEVKIPEDVQRKMRAWAKEQR